MQGYMQATLEHIFMFFCTIGGGYGGGGYGGGGYGGGGHHGGGGGHHGGYGGDHHGNFGDQDGGGHDIQGQHSGGVSYALECFPIQSFYLAHFAYFNLIF